MPPKPPKRRIPPPSPLSRTIHADSSNLDNPPDAPRVERTFESPSTSSISDVQRPVANENGVAGADTSRVEDHENNSDSHISSEGTRSRQVEVFEILEEARAKQEEASSAHFDATGEQPCRPRRNNARRVDDAIASSEREKGVEDARVQGESAMRTMKSEVASDKRSCTVISTIPKCEHFDLTTEDDDDRRNMGDFGAPLDRAGTTLDSMTSRGLVQSSVEAEEGPNDVGIQNVEMIREGVRNAKRARMLRSMSKTNDFEINSAMKQKKHLSSNAEDITCALNLSLSSSSSLSSEVFNVEFDKERGKDRSSVSRDVAGGDSGRDLTGTSDDAAGPSQTDILLQKVSDTLSGTLPVPSSKETTSQPPAGPEPEVSNSQKASTDESIKKPEASIETKTSPKAEPPKEPRKPTIEAPEEKTLNASTPNMTISSQQDTSDYVSAVGEDLSITEWEYQLPAPPSAFRDSNSPVFDGYDTITLRSVEAFKEPVPNHVDQIDSCAKEAPKSHEKLIEDRSANELSNREKAKESIKVENEVEVQNLGTESKSCSKQVSVDRQKAQPNAVLKKEIISELENKIGSGSLSQAMNKETESRRTVDQSSTPRIAPTDNTLSNFTITTYRRQKSLNIFEEIDERQNVSTAKRTDDRFVNSFPTLARNRGTVDAEQRSGTKEGANGVNGECKKGEPKIQGQAEPLHRWQSCNGSGTERSNVQRSKSYLSAINGAAHHRDGHGGSEECRNPNFETSPGSKTAEVPRSNEKFSQWRENILKRQEEPTKEKQLQSLQVLKSILPQLKSAQQAEENVSKEYSNAVLSETIGSENASNEHSVEANVVSTRESQGASVPEESRERHEKRYTYAGPPAISLGSWSERPTVSVQIKMDTDYKLGSSNGAAANNKTVVNIGSMKAEKNTNSSESFGKTNEKSLGRKSVDQQENSTSRASVENKVTDGPTKKFITHTTASGFKKPTESKVSVSELKSRVDDRPIVTGVELKKNAIEAEETSKSKESAIDTTPLNFKELTKAFGQDICLRPKPKRLSANRFSDCYNAQSESIQQITDINNKQNGYASSEKIRSQADIVSNNQTITNGDANKTKLRKFTSIVGIHPSNQNYGEQNGDFSVKNTVNIMKSNPLKPVAKGFKTADAKLNGIQISQNGLSSSECPKKVPQPPKPPTMPVITGVTLKSASARPKSMPVQIDPRDVLLESIRNFGGRQNLKSAAERY
ncbi:hypothetical protein KM043_012810 [Ampulex compressa]|nr:hypothetical protein KM043_012810 [Ampulex compressa]